MKIAFVSLALAAAGLAQDEMSTPPAVAPTVSPMEMPPQAVMPYGQMERSADSLVGRLMSFFDLSNVDASLTSAPVAMAHVYDPRSRKFVMLSMPVVKSGEAYYMPACPAGAMSRQPQQYNVADCGYGIPLTPMPRNAAALLFRALRTKARMLLNLAKPSQWTQVQTSM
ncbi:hypothetical protein EV183_001480 [Coemansia sp. RSA 2336]|nr:hypothetical protein EV183_001480 [Coemansia sp. RSA 2336]